jgi:hypothetical protein
MKTGTRAWRGIFLALALLVTAGALSACDDSGGAGDAPPPPPPTQN